jgi:hypothetical protein
MHEQEFFDRLNHGHEDDRPDDDPLSEEDQATESLLKDFVPASSGIDRDRLMYLAGRAAAFAEAGPRPSHRSRAAGNAWIWPAATAVMSATSLALAIALVIRPAPSIAEREGSAPPAHRQEPQIPDPSGMRALVHDAAPAQRTELDDPRGAERSEAVEFAGSRARNYLQQREIALNHGVDALPTAASAESVARAALPQRKLLEELLPPAAGQASDSAPFGDFFSWPLFNQSEDNL